MGCECHVLQADRAASPRYSIRDVTLNTRLAPVISNSTNTVLQTTSLGVQSIYKQSVQHPLSITEHSIPKHTMSENDSTPNEPKVRHVHHAFTLQSLHSFHT